MGPHHSIRAKKSATKRRSREKKQKQERKGGKARDHIKVEEQRELQVETDRRERKERQ